MINKKNKKSNQKRKARTEYTYFTSKEIVGEINITFDPATQSFGANMPITNAYHEVTYEREGKPPKSLNRIQFYGDDFSLSSNDTLRKYDVVVAIDTNDRELAGVKFSATGVIVAKWMSEATINKHVYTYETPFCIEFSALNDPREIIGWCVALVELNKRGFFSGGVKVAVVVDSYLSEIPKINARELPLYGGFFLPENLTLMYASADAGAEYIANNLIKHADNAAKMTLDFIESGRAPKNENFEVNKPWERIRFIMGKKP